MGRFYLELNRTVPLFTGTDNNYRAFKPNNSLVSAGVVGS